MDVPGDRPISPATTEEPVFVMVEPAKMANAPDEFRLTVAGVVAAPASPTRNQPVELATTRRAPVRIPRGLLYLGKLTDLRNVDMMGTSLPKTREGRAVRYGPQRDSTT